MCVVVAVPWCWAGSLLSCCNTICSFVCAGMFLMTADLLPNRLSFCRRRLIVLSLCEKLGVSNLNKDWVLTWSSGRTQPQITGILPCHPDPHGKGLWAFWRSWDHQHPLYAGERTEDCWLQVDTYGCYCTGFCPLDFGCETWMGGGNVRQDETPVFKKTVSWARTRR